MLHLWMVFKRIAALVCAVGIAVLSARAQNPPATRQQVASALKAHQYKEAVRLLAPLLQASPKDASLWTLRGVALEGEGHTQESLQSFRYALALDGSFMPALEGAAQTSYLHRDPSALRNLENLLAQAPDNEVGNAMAGALTYRLHECERSIGYFERSKDTVYRDASAINEYADCLLRQRHVQQAIALLSRAVELYPQSSQFKYNLAVAHLQDHRPAEAVAVLAPLESVKDADLLNLLAHAYEQSNRPDDAFRVLETAIRLSPQDETNYLDLAILCLEHYQEQRSVMAATAGIARIPKASSLYLIRGVAYAQLAKYKQAESDFTTAAELEPNQPHSTIAMSLLYSDRNQLDKEKALLLKQLAITPKDAVTNYLFADLLIRSGALPGQPDYEKAIAHLTTSLAAKPDSAEARILMAKLLMQEGHYADALNHINIAVKLEPTNQSALNRQFVLLRKLHRNEEATQVLIRLKTILNDDLRRDTQAGQIRIGDGDSLLK
jgi:tetratricopeptide (TPR) repeat protein